MSVVRRMSSLVLLLFSMCDGFVEETGILFQSSASSGTLSMRASLFKPDASSFAPPWKAAVLFHGSGEEIDRYGSLPSKLLFGWQLKPRASTLCSIKSTGAFRVYEQLAQFLASLGFATLLYDKRGCSSCGYAPCSSTTASNCFQSGNITFEDLMTDTAAAVAFIKTRSDLRASDITVIGHSQGCTIVSTLAASTAGVGRAIRLMGLGRSYYDLSYRQYAANLQTDLSHQGYCDDSDPNQLAQKNFVFANVLPNSRPISMLRWSTSRCLKEDSLPASVRVLGRAKPPSLT